VFGSDDLADDVLPRVLTFAVDAVTACDWASITLNRQGAAGETFASDPLAADLDEFQFHRGVGPAHEALQSGAPVMDPLLSESARWPELATIAGRLGVESCLSYGLFRPQAHEAFGVFTMYSASPVAFAEEERDLGSILAAYITTAVAIARRRDEVDRREAALHRALSTRDVIGQAKGILMERQHLSAGEAFDLLRRVSQRLNRKLADIAEHLADTGELP
jgi:hypothetical protein